MSSEATLPTARDQPSAKEDDGDGFYSKSNDPVRMYLRKMGSVSLLTREGEVEIAKRIEQGEHAVFNAILNSPVAVREIIDLGDKLRKHKIRVKEIIRDADDENAEFDEEEADRRILRLIDKVKHLDKVAQDLGERFARRCVRPAQHRRARATGKANAAQSAGAGQSAADTFDRMKEKVRHSEAFSQAKAELIKDDVEEQLVSLEKQDQIEKMLAEMKAKRG